MPEGTERRPEPGDEGEQRLQVAAAHVRVGDVVVYTSKLNAEYRFTVTDVDDEWITFRTGQKVHADRFDREPFAVIREQPEGVTLAGADTASDESSQGTGRAEHPDRADRTDRTEHAGNEATGRERSPTQAE